MEEKFHISFFCPEKDHGQEEGTIIFLVDGSKIKGMASKKLYCPFCGKKSLEFAGVMR